MKIFLVSPPFSGHLHPIIAIAKRLAQDCEMSVTIISTLAAKTRVENENISFLSILNGYDAKIDSIANPLQKIKNNPFKLIKQLKENISILEQFKLEFELLIRELKPDLIIADFTLPIAGIVAKENGITWHTTLPSPCVYESNGVPAYIGGLYPPQNFYQELKHNAINKLIPLFKRSCYFLFKNELKKLNFNSIYDNQGIENIYSKKRIYALGMKELEFNQPSDSIFKYVGPVLYSPKPMYENELIFNDKKKYVLVTMGTHLKFMKNDLINSIKNLALFYPEIEFQITMGESESNINKEIQNVKILNYISYEKYLDNYSYVIHHGGAGILNECIKRAIPSLCFPQDYDQFDNASRLDYYGLCVKIIKFNDLNCAFKQLLKSESIVIKNEQYKKILNSYNAVESIYQEIKTLQF